MKIKRLPIDTHPDNTAFMLRGGQEYTAEQFQALQKIRIYSEGREILATLALVDDRDILQEDQIGLGQQAYRRLGLNEGVDVEIEQAHPPASLEWVRRKIDGDTLTDSELAEIITDIAAYRYSPMEIGAFLVACAGYMTTQETLGITNAMIAVGRRLQWDRKPVVDKHCIGGIPGNRTSMIVVPIVAAHGLLIPKTSSRAITSPAGTADTMEVLARVDLSRQEMADVAAEHGAFLAWGGKVQLSPADDILISVERPLRIDTHEQMVASILSKKVSAGSTHLVLDIPVGPTAKVRSQAEAVRLRKTFEYVARHLGLETEIVFSDGSQPVGRGIGPVLEAEDVMAVLRNEEEAPQDLREHALVLAGRIIDFDPELEGGKGYSRAFELLASGAALEKMEQLIEAQGRQTAEFPLGVHREDVRSPDDGHVQAIDCERMARIARLAGAPMDKGAGIKLLRKVGEPVRQGETLYHIFANSRDGLRFADAMAAEANGYDITS